MIEISKNEIIRTLGLYQPYASLMLHGKIETRWVSNERTPPFPLGKYLLYSTKKAYKEQEFKHISGEFYQDAINALKDDTTVTMNGFGLCIGDLVKIEKCFPLMMPNTFVGLRKIANQLDLHAEPNDLQIDDHLLWALHFENVIPIEPFAFKGKQGVGFLSEEDRAKIKFAA